MSYPFLQSLWDAYMEDINAVFVSHTQAPKTIPIPYINQKELTELLQMSTDLFRMEDVVLSLSGDVQIVGDLHGHIFDLYRIFANCGKPDKTRYLFLGDLIDRGSFSLETVTLILLAKVLFPTSVYVIRGNHEFVQMAHQFGFEKEIVTRFGSNILLAEFGKVFSYLPLAVLLNNEYLCIHGGLSPNLFSINQIRAIQKPFDSFESIIPASILWSDPKDNVDKFEPSTRGVGFFFGKSVTHEFLKENKILKIIRGHECVADGYLSQFNGSIITVFSASNYCGVSNNKSCVLGISEKGELDPHVFEPLPYLTRHSATFKLIKSEISMANSAFFPERRKKNIVRCIRRSSNDTLFSAIHNQFHEVHSKLAKHSPAKSLPQI